MQIGVRKETSALETRVAVTPDGVKKLLKLGFSLVIEAGAGEAASYTDQAYEQAGATVVPRDEVYQSDIIFAVNPPEVSEVEKFKANSILVSFVHPAQNTDLVAALQAKNITSLAMDMVPRISRAQAMDALSSLANIAGYRAVIEAANNFGRFLNGQITAAGKIAPARVLVIGAGVAGLAAIGTAKNLGAQVVAFDARPEAKDQVESMGAKFLTIDYKAEVSTDGYTRSTTEEFNRLSAELYAKQAKEVDIIITTANIPGRRAPLLLTKAMVDSMKPGSVVIDLAAQTGGNCEYTQPNQTVVTDNDVRVVGITNYAALLPQQSSTLYSNNLCNLAALLSPAKDGTISLNLEDVIVRNMLVTQATETGPADLMFPPPPISVSAAPQAKAGEGAEGQKSAQAEGAEEGKCCVSKFVCKLCSCPKFRRVAKWVGFAILVYLYYAIATYLPAKFLEHFNVFVVASVLGYYIIWNVHSALHTPLMSLTNALSGIVVVGAMYQLNPGQGMSHIIALVAIFIASLNVFGGFAITQRMLSMFIKKSPKAETKVEAETQAQSQDPKGGK